MHDWCLSRCAYYPERGNNGKKGNQKIPTLKHFDLLKNYFANLGMKNNSPQITQINFQVGKGTLSPLASALRSQLGSDNLNQTWTGSPSLPESFSNFDLTGRRAGYRSSADQVAHKAMAYSQSGLDQAALT